MFRLALRATDHFASKKAWCRAPVSRCTPPLHQQSLVPSALGPARGAKPNRKTADTPDVDSGSTKDRPMSLAMKPPITRQSVFATCDELLLKNSFPDNGLLASVTGASIATVAPLRDAWWSDLLARVEGSELLLQSLERTLHKDLRIREHVGARCQPSPAILSSDQNLQVKLRDAQTRAYSAEFSLAEERARVRSLIQEESDRHISLIGTIVRIKDLACEALRASDQALLNTRAAERDRLIDNVEELTKEIATLRAMNAIED